MSTSDSTDSPPPVLSKDAAGEPDGGPPFPVVGVGASAGGLEALTELFGGLSPQPGLAFVIAVHLDPHHKSHLPEILSKTTPMSVHEVREDMAVRLNEVYLIPPNTNMALADGHLKLTPRSPAPGSHMPIDHLFRSLAAVQQGRAIGVVLSGGGTDGALGMQAIKSEGGITFAQDEKTAKQASMPRAAILDGTIDYVLRPRDIANELERIAQHSYSREAVPPAKPPPETKTFEDILALLHNQPRWWSWPRSTRSNAELARVNNDLVNLLSGVSIPIVMVSRDLRIRRFTPVAEKVFNLIPTDVGRPISDIKPNLNVEDLASHIAGVIDSLTPFEREVRTRDRHWYSLRIRPYVTLDNKIDGASIVLYGH